jgi:isochorismate synthase EntC
VHLFAGAGIVAGSDPREELAETSVKLRALLDVIDR